MGYKKFNIEHKFDVKSVVTLYAEWIREGRFKLDPSRNEGRVTLHDPCNVVRKAKIDQFPAIGEDARFVLKQVAPDFVESTPNRENNFCCSGGGGALINGFARARSHFGMIKLDQIKRSGANKVCTPCVNCYDGINNIAMAHKEDYEFEPVHLWTLLANAIILD